MFRHQSSDEMINDQIEREIRKLDSILTDEADKPAIIQRITALKNALDHPIDEIESEQPESLREIGLTLARAFMSRK